MPSESQQSSPEPAVTPPLTVPSQRLGPMASAFMYCAALSAGVVLVVVGQATPIEASGYIAPFLVVFEGVRARQ